MCFAEATGVRAWQLGVFGERGKRFSPFFHGKHLLTPPDNRTKFAVFIAAFLEIHIVIFLHVAGRYSLHAYRTQTLRLADYFAQIFSVSRLCFNNAAGEFRRVKPDGGAAIL
jgi:hypothetical protein